MTRSRLVGAGLLVALVGASLAWVGWRVARAPTAPAPAALVSTEQPRPWSTGYLIVPERAEPTPISRLERRLGKFTKTVERARAGEDPPLRAFGAEELTAEIEQAIARVSDRAEVSVHVRDLETQRILFDFHGDTPLNPASNNKLLVGSAALDLLGSDYVFETRVILIGDALYLVGAGDPTLDGEGLRGLADQIAERVAIGSVAKIVVDESAFTTQTFGPGYRPEQTDEAYMAPSGAMSLAFNSVEITLYPIGKRKTAVTVEPPSTNLIIDNQARVGPGRLKVRSLAEPIGRTTLAIEGAIPNNRRGLTVRRRIHDPGRFSGGALAIALADATQSEPLPVEIGVLPPLDSSAEAETEAEVGDDIERDGEASLPRMIGRNGEGVDVELVALRRSPALIDVVSGMLTWSNNFTAEQLLRTLAWQMTDQPGDWDQGREIVRAYWQALGQDPEDLVYENGSGLSSIGRVTTRGLVDLLATAHRTQPRGSSLIDALPIAGTEGTLSGRLRRSGKRVRAKTGTMAGVSGLTGVITSDAGEPKVAFSIIINVRDTATMFAESRRAIEDQIVMAVLEHIDNWVAVSGPIVDLEPLEVSAAPG